MNTKWIFSKGIGLGLGLSLMACEPIQDNSWFDNETVNLDWTYANPTTGSRPSEVESFSVSYYPQEVKDKQFRFDYMLTDDQVSLPMQSGYYDLLAISDNQVVDKDKYFKSAKVVFETVKDSIGNRYFAKEATEMIYKGQLQNQDANYSDS